MMTPKQEKIDITRGELDAISSTLKDLTLIIGRIKKRINAYATATKMQARGTKPGRHKKRDDKLIASLRDRGMSMRAIAKLAGVSTTAVHRSLWERENAD